MKARPGALPQPNRPFWYRLINAHYRFAAKLGYARPFSAERMVAGAIRRNGGQGFGDNSFREGLDAYVAALNDEAGLNGFGRVAIGSMIRLLLQHRLRLEAWRQAHPEVAQQTIRRPLIIAGLPRTGTTILHQLLSQDAQFRAPRRFEIDRPVPPPAEHAVARRDPRVRQVQRGLDVIHGIVPHFMAIHPMAAPFPDECQQITAYQFSSIGLQHIAVVPSFQRWLLDHDFSRDLQFHQRFLQHLQSAWHRDHWLLKSPAHVQYLPTLLATYPDAMILHTHRRPAEIMGSVSSLSWTMQEVFSDDADPLRCGRGQAWFFTQMTRMTLRDREAMGPTDAIFDLRFGDFVADPLDSVRRIYSHFGLQLTPAAASAMANFLAANQQHKHGHHRYDAAVFGVADIDDDAVMRDYRRRFQL